MTRARSSAKNFFILLSFLIFPVGGGPLSGLF